MGFDILKQIFTGKYNVPSRLHERKEKTLTKLAIFLGYEDWDDFKKFANGTKSKTELEEELFQVILTGKTLEFAFYSETSYNDGKIYSELEKYFSLSFHCTEFRAIFSRIRQARMDEIVILPNNSDSEFEIFKPRLLEIRNNKALMQVEEYWRLEWFNIDGSKHHNEIDRNSYVYFLIKENGKWKIFSKMTSPDERINLSLK